MGRSPDQIVGEIRTFEPLGGNWLRLDSLLDELFNSGSAATYLADLLAVLERFPEEDGAGVLWSIVHGVESLPGYEAELVESLRRRPAELTVAMIRRLLNGGVMHVRDISLVELMRQLASLETLPTSIRAAATRAVQKFG